MNAFLSAIESLFHTVTTLSAKGALLAVITGAVLLMMSKKMSPAWRHGLWMLVFLRLMLPDVAASRWSMTGWLPMAPAIAPVVVEPVPTTVLNESTSEAPIIEPESETTPVTVVSPRAPATTAPAASKPAPLTVWQTLSIVWLAGALAVVAAMVALHVRLWRRVRRDRQGATDEMLRLLRQCSTQMGVRRVPELVITQAVQAPAVFGLVRPSVLLPADLEVDTASLRLVLLHELAHLRRRDLWVQVIAALAVAAHWFNPLAWWASRRLRAEAELAADACVLRLTEKAEAHRFGEVLLSFASRAAAGWALWFSAATMLSIAEGRHDLRRRIDAIVDFSRGRRAWWIVGMLAFVLLAFTGLTTAPAEEVKKELSSTAKMTVSGVVVDEEGKPIEGASVTLSNYRSRDFTTLRFTTKEDGVFRFEDALPASGDMDLSYRREGYMEPKPLFTKVSAHKREGMRLTLAKATGWVTGTISNKATGLPIKGATVWLEKEPLSLLSLGLSLKGKQTTDAAGHFRLQPTSSAKGTLMIDAPGMALTTRSFVWRGGELTLDAAILPDTRMTGRVMSADGSTPVAGVVLCLSSSSWLPDLKERPSKIRPDAEFSRYGLSFWPGDALTKGDGTFDGRSIDSDSESPLWMFAIHPTEGIKWMRFRDWKLGGTIHLDRWNILEGKVIDQNGKPMSKAKVEIANDVRVFDSDNQFGVPVSRVSTCITDEAGHYRVEQVLPHSRSSFVRINGSMVPRRETTFSAGEKREFDILLQAMPSDLLKKAPKEHMRRVTAKIVTPEGFKPVSEDYEIRVNVELAGERRWVSVTPDADGRIETEPVAPGQYLLRAWVNSKDRKLSAVAKGVSMQFRLDDDPTHPLIDLGDIKLGPDNFKFEKEVSNSGRRASKQAPQQLNAKIIGDERFVTWAGSSGGEWSPELAVTADGRVEGSTPVNSSRCFVLRAKKADGSIFFTDALIGKQGELFVDQVSFSPAVTLEGKLNELPPGYAGDGWIAAADEVYIQLPPARLQEGHLPLVTWRAWAPVRADGKFKFHALPRGGMFLMGFGPGWTSSSATGSMTLYHLNLTESKAEHEVKIDARPTVEKKLRVVMPDGSPAANAKITVTSVGSTWWDRPLTRSGHDFDPSDAEGYQRYTKSRIPGHSAVTNAEGRTLLRNLPDERFATITCQVEWTKSGTLVREQIDIRPGNPADQEVTLKLAGKNR